MMRAARKELGLATAETIMIGDTMETDILGGVSMGYRTALVLTGGTRREDLQRYAYRPDFILNSIADLCDDVSVMYAGQIVETGSVRDVLLRPEHPYTMALLAADPHAILGVEGAPRLASIPGQVPLPGSWTSGCRFAPRCRFARDACLTEIPLEPRAEGVGTVHCIRRDEVLGRQEEWRQPVLIGGVDL